jgi:hypothetical protein
LLQEFVQVSDWQVNNFWILLFQNNIWWILFHLFMESFSFLLNGLNHLYLFWYYELRKIHFSKIFIIINFFNYIDSPAPLGS